jgi:hypothetical protein
MKSKERVIRAIEFRSPDRVPICSFHLPTRKFGDFLINSIKYKTDIMMTSFIYKRKKIDKETAMDSWGAVWRSLGNKGEVISSPLKDWSNLDNLKVPDYADSKSLFFIRLSRMIFKRKFLIGALPDMVFSLCQYLRGFTEFMIDLYEYKDEMIKLASIITELNLRLIDRYADLKMDAVMGWDDLGLQNSLMISPEMFQEVFKPAYKAMIDRAHERGMKFILHSCGYIIDIIEDFVEIGLDVIQCDQQDNMGIDNLNKRYGGRITFFCPADIQTTLPSDDPEKIRLKALELKSKLGGHDGGLIGKVYPTPKDIGVSEKSIGVMLKAFRE